MRKKIVAGNYKMNLSKDEALNLLAGIKDFTFNEEGKQLMIFPPSIYLDSILADKGDTLFVGAQNGFYKESGAFTGEVSFKQLKELGVEAVLIGHSERRELFSESNEIIKRKVDAAITNNLIPIFCCGEPLVVREENVQKDYVIQQLKESIFHLSEHEFKKVVVAYEPIWAIGTGKTADASQAEEMHADIRDAIAKQYNAELANETSILYGGSCKPSNADELFACENVDGGLIGGASLKVEDFIALAKAL